MLSSLLILFCPLPLSHRGKWRPMRQKVTKTIRIELCVISWPMVEGGRGGCVRVTVNVLMYCKGLNTNSFWVPRNLSNHMDRQALTGELRERWQVGAKHCRGGWGEKGVQTTENKIHWPRWGCTVLCTWHSLKMSVNNFCHLLKWELQTRRHLYLASLLFVFLLSLYTANTKYRNFETNIPRKGISGSQSQFPHSFVCEWFIYSHDLSAYSAGGNM